MKTHYAILAGCCGAAGSAFGKLCGLSVIENALIARIICFGAMIICNTSSMTFFVKALHQSDSSLIATVISSTSNYGFSAILGFVLFQEMVSLYWWIGIFFIIVGLILAVSDNESKTKCQ